MDIFTVYIHTKNIQNEMKMKQFLAAKGDLFRIMRKEMLQIFSVRIISLKGTEDKFHLKLRYFGKSLLQLEPV